MKWIMLFTSLLALSFPLCCQPINLSFEHLNANDGLEGKYNDFIFKDSRGFVWISSTIGLHRFDGFGIKLYSSENMGGKGMLGKSIQSRCSEDSKGNIWFSTLKGINCYQWRKDQFKSFQLTDENGRIIDEDYNSFFLEKDSILWTLANGVLYRFNINNDTQSKVIDTKGIRFAVDTTLDGSVKVIYACPWLKNSGIEIIKISEKGFPSKKVLFKEGLPGSTSKQIEISGAIVQNSDRIWFFTDKGLIKFTPQRPLEIQKFNLPNEKTTAFKDGDLLEDRYLFLATENSGLWIFDSQTDRFSKHYSYLENDPNGLVSNSIREVYIDPEQHLWLASKSSAEIDHSWIHNNLFKNPLEKFSPTINSIVEDKKKRIWCSSINKGVFVLNNNGNLLQKFEYKSNSNSNVLKLSPIQHLRTDRQGNVWALSKQFLFQFDSRSNRWNKVFDAKEKRLNDFVFLSTTTGIIATTKGVFRFDLEDSGRLVSLREKIKPNGNEDFQAFNLFQARSDMAYFPMKSSELWFYQLDSDSTFTFDLETEVHDIWEDATDSITWVGTLDGLFSINRKSMGLAKHDVRHRAKAPQILGITADKTGKLWLPTNMGLWSYDNKVKEFYQLLFQSDKETFTDQFSLFANLSASNGNIWLGTNRGLFVFDPVFTKPYTVAPKIHFRGIEINQKSYTTHKHLDELNTLDLSYNENTIDFKINALSSYRPKLNMIQYQLKGINETWVSVGNGENISFQNLSPGEYQLNAFASNSNGINGPVKKININISPPLWRRPWFILLSALIFIVIIISSFRFYLKQKLKNQKREFERQKALETALQNERNRIAGEMHDDLGGGLTSIRLLLKKIQPTSLQNNSIEYLNKVETYAGELIENMGEIIWAMNSNNDNLIDLIAYLRKYAINFLEDHSIECKADIPDNLPEISIGGQKRRNIFLCVKECTHNVVKHSKAQKVNIHFQWNGYFKIIIQDDGIGFDLQNANEFGNGLKNMKQRMEDIDGSFDFEHLAGTKIILTIPLH